MKRSRSLAALFLLAGLQAAGAAQPPVPLEYFGMHIHHAETLARWPDVPFGSWRLWDAGVNWAQLEPARGKWDFARLDRLVALAKDHNQDLLLPLAAPPKWASARPDEAGALGAGMAAEPASLDDWREYVGTVARRYRGTIHHYEIWNEPSDKSFYTGSVATLVRLTCEASRILKEIDPANAVTSPSSAGGGRHIAYLDDFLAQGGKDCVDLIGHHFYVFQHPPEAMVPLIREVRAVMKKNGVGDKGLWNTETGWWIANADDGHYAPWITKGGWTKLERGHQAGDYVLHALLLARAEGVGRFFWYAWNNQSMGMIEPDSGADKPMVQAWRDAVDLLVGATDVQCAQQGREWTCTLVRRDGRPARVAWTAE